VLGLNSPSRNRPAPVLRFIVLLSRGFEIRFDSMLVLGSMYVLNSSSGVRLVADTTSNITVITAVSATLPLWSNQYIAAEMIALQ